LEKPSNIITDSAKLCHEAADHDDERVPALWCRAIPGRLGDVRVTKRWNTSKVALFGAFFGIGVSFVRSLIVSGPGEIQANWANSVFGGALLGVIVFAAIAFVHNVVVGGE
jgi:hypothetical protein